MVSTGIMKYSGVIQLLRDLVAIPSVNPQGDPGTDRTGEEAIAKFIAGFLRRIGAEVELQYVEPGRPNVIGRLGARGRARRTIALGPHMDTVSVRGMTIAPFTPVVRGGRLYGRGASDTKGNVAAFLWAMKRLSESRTARRDNDIYFAGLMGEESGNDGVKHLMRRGRSKLSGKLDFAIVGEPTAMQIVNAHKGALWLRLSTLGRSCHGATPELGENAIYKMARVVDWLEHDYAARLTRRHPVLGPATLNVGTIHGGSKVNIVPARCEIEVDHRTLPGEDHMKLLRELKARFGRMEAEILNDNAGLDTPASHPLVVQLAAAGGSRCVGAPWFSDGAIFARHGVPAVAFGAGSIAQAHTRDEFTSVVEVERCAAVMETFLANLS
jgi:acetylornithine deacetylase/succinyl-diaminopimelate desuccinylase family protein